MDKESSPSMKKSPIKNRNFTFKKFEKSTPEHTEYAILNWAENHAQYASLEKLYGVLPPEYQNNKQVCQTIVHNNAMCFSFLPTQMKAIPEIALEAIRSGSFGYLKIAFNEIPDELLENKQFIMDAMIKNVSSLMFADDKFKKDREILTHGLKLSAKDLLSSLNNNEMFWNVNFLKEAFTYDPVTLYDCIKEDEQVSMSFRLYIGRESEDFFIAAFRKMNSDIKSDRIHHFMDEKNGLVGFTLDRLSLNFLKTCPYATEGMRSLMVEKIADKEILEMKQKKSSTGTKKKRAILS